MAQQIRVLDAESNDLSLINRTTRHKERNNSIKFCYNLIHVHVHRHTKKRIITIKHLKGNVDMLEQWHVSGRRKLCSVSLLDLELCWASRRTNAT